MAPNEGKKKGELGDLTRVTVPVFKAKAGDFEEADALFEAGQSPAPSVNSSPAKKKKGGTPKKPKKDVRFSLGTTQGSDDEEDLELAAINSTAKNMARYNNRESMDASDLSSVSTAPPVTAAADDVEEARNSNDDEEEEIAALGNQKNTPPALAVANNDDNDDDDGGFPVDDDMDDDDDDLVPPSPPHEENDDEREEDPITQDEEAVDESVPFPDADDNPASPVNDFPTDNYDDDDDDDDKEGTGFQMEDPETPDDPETPESVREMRLRKEERKKKLEKKKKDAASARSKDKKKKKKRKVNESIEESSEEETTVKKRKPKKKKFNRFATTFSPKGVPGPRTFTQIPVSELKGDSPEDSGLRRSKRVKMPPLEFWRGESVEYGANDFGNEYDGVKNMPVVVGISKANPTPYKKRKAPPAVPKKKADKKGKKKSGDEDEVAAAEEEPFDSSGIRAKYDYNDGKMAQLWDERYGETREIKVVAYHSNMEARKLPLSKSRKKGEGKVVGKAAQSFHMTNDENPAYPGYIVGSLVLPPKAIKDAESVGLCAQVFTIVKGQAGSIEIAFGDPDQEGAVWDPDSAERFLLSVGDNFLIPPGNSYRIQNHSKTTEALLSWTIIRHNPGVGPE